MALLVKMVDTLVLGANAFSVRVQLPRRAVFSSLDLSISILRSRLEKTR